LVPTIRVSKPSIGPRLVLVECLALRHALDHVDEHHCAGQVLLGQPLGCRRTHVAGTDYRDLLEHCGQPWRESL
jgi:hypothetical protein